MKTGKILSLTVMIMFVFSAFALADYQLHYTATGKHDGGDVTPNQAIKMMREDSEHTYLIDVRSSSDYQEIGHPVDAISIPFELGESFTDELKARFNPETDILLVMSKHGVRSAAAVNAAIQAGFQRSFNVLDANKMDHKLMYMHPKL